MDLLTIGIGIAFFVFTWGLVRLCETPGTDETGVRS
jgi:hypothetical protein